MRCPCVSYFNLSFLNIIDGLIIKLKFKIIYCFIIFHVKSFGRLVLLFDATFLDKIGILCSIKLICFLFIISQ